MSDLKHFPSVYDELTDIAVGSSHHYWPGHLKKWFANLDNTPVVTALIAALEAKVDFHGWYGEQQEQAKNAGMGGGRLTFPDDSDRELGMKLQLFRRIGEGRIQSYQLGHMFLPRSGGDVVSHTDDVKDQLFLPFARELRRALLNHIPRESRPTVPEPSVPAADRVVSIKHNTDEYATAVKALDRLEHTLKTANDFNDTEERDQRVAEVRATRTLLEATRVRIAALVELLRPLVQQFATKLKDSIIGLAVSGLLAALGALLAKLAGLF